MTMSIKRNILNNGIASALQKMIRVLEQLFLVPFFISAWGAAYYGEWLTLTIIPSVLAFSDLGFGSAAANTFVLRYVSGDRQGAANISRTGFLITTGTFFSGILLGAILILILTSFNLLKNSLISTHDAVWALSFMILARLIAFYSQLYDAYFRAARKAALGINLLTINAVLNIFVGFVVLKIGEGIVIFAFSQFIIAIFFNIIYRWKAIYTLKLNKEHIGTFVKGDSKEILSKGFGYLLTPVWQSIYFQGTTLVVRLTLGPQAVAVFNTVRTLSRSVNQMYSLVNSSVFPELQYEIGIGNMDKARILFRRSIQGSLVIALVGVVFLAIFGLLIYNLWTKNELIPPNGMWYIFLIGILFNAVWWTAAMVFRAYNKPYDLAISGLIASLLSVLFSYIFCEFCKWGLVGAALGTLVMEIIMACYILPKSRNIINSNVLFD